MGHGAHEITVDFNQPLTYEEYYNSFPSAEVTIKTEDENKYNFGGSSRDLLY